MSGEGLTGDAISFFDEGRNAYAEGVDEGHRADWRARRIGVVLAILVALYFFALVVPKNLLNWQMTQLTSSVTGGYTASIFIAELQQNVSDMAAYFTGNLGSASGSFNLLVVRYLVIAAAGAGLALSGAVYQGAFRNALVSPSTLGVMNGANFGLMIWVVLFAGGGAVTVLSDGFVDGGLAGDVLAYLSSSYGVAIISFIGCLAVVGLVLLTMRLAGGGSSAIMMIITGQVVGGVLSAISSTVRYYYVYTDPYGEIAQMLTQLQIASFWRPFTWVDLIAILVPLGVTFGVVMHLRQKMMALAFDEQERRAMGIDGRRMQYAVVILCTLLTAIIVSFCGSVGFVGFLVPHLARRIVGPNFKYLLPASAAVGALFVLGAYVLLQVTFGNDYETMVGMYISIAGAIVFLATALKGGAANGTFR